jgi:hypothetical protein
MTESPHIEDEQRRIAELLRSFDTPAPESLHRRIEALMAPHQRQFAPRSSRRVLRRFSPLGLAGAGAVAAAVVAVAIVVGLGGGGGSVPTVSFSQAAASTLRAATLPAPPESHAHHSQLAVAVNGVPFPYWEDRFGWRSTGSRTDRVDGRSITTVFYANSSGRRIGYAILAGTPAPRIDGGVIAWRGGVSYRLLSENGAAVVTWLRDGHLCVLSGRGISSATLLKLASWSEGEATAS